MAPGSILICGAGLAGLSVAGELLAAGYAGELTLLDRRTSHPRDRTWCTWATPGALGRFEDAVTWSWDAWSVVAPDGGVTRQSGGRHPYVHLDADRVHALGLDRVAAAANARVELGVHVHAIDAVAGRVDTDRGSLQADLVVDALAAGSPRARGRRPGARAPRGIELSQRFVGWEVRTERPAFVPGEAVLMDFAALAGDPGDVRFLYVLPFDAHHALIEDTSIGSEAPAPEARRRALAAWLDARGAGTWAIERTERGRIPMRTDDPGARLGPRGVAAGEAAGAVRPSSGYAFSRTQRHARALARAVVAGTPPPATVGTARSAALDRVFLRALVDDPSRAPDVFARLLAGTTPEAFARFMTDASSPLDEARLMTTVPKAAFARAALRA